MKHLLLKDGTLKEFRRMEMMGIINVTPDSFYEGSRAGSIDEALAKAEQMIQEGAAFIDVGGESTRPGAAPVDVPEEISRVCHANGIRLYVDGARLAYALACPENDVTLPDLARLCDMTGRGALAAEYRDMLAGLDENIQEHAWKGTFFARALLNGDKGYTYVGAAGDGLSLDPAVDGSYFLNCFSWSILAA